jgi:trehalose 6-phosphate phosphatase
VRRAVRARRELRRADARQLGQRREEPLSSTLTSMSNPAAVAPATAQWCLFLDVDGTLLDIAPTPDAVRVEDSLKELLTVTRDALGGALALVSGRSIATLDALFAPHIWPAAGLHGIERRDAMGCVHFAAPDAPSLDLARDALAALAAATPGVLLEDKGRTLALHYRAVPEREAELSREVRAVAGRLGDQYHVLEGNRVLELKPAAATKADAIRAFMREVPFTCRWPIFIGDDLTDLDGFAAVERAGGMSVAVGDRVQAQVRVASPRDVRMLLADLAEGRVAGA